MRGLSQCGLLLVACLFLAVSPSLVSARALFSRRHVDALSHRLTSEATERASQTIDAQWLTQKLDHEDLVSTATFQQLYYVNDTFYNSASPIVLLMIGGEGPLSPAYVTNHFVTGLLSAKYGAIQVALEHRFYGQSVPNNDSSTANLKYLSSSQALEDLVTLHEVITAQYGEAKWIVFGGSYSGAMSAWARLKFPNLFLGSFASSGPVEAELDFYQYFDVVSNSVGDFCSAQLASAQGTIDGMMEIPAGQLKLQQMFNLCAPIGTSENDIANFQSAITGPVAETVQYNDDQGRTQFDINTICDIMAGAADSITGFVDVWNAYNTHTGMNTCTDVSYKNYIESMQATSDARSWTWQTCTEFGYFQTGESGSQPFSSDISLQFYLDQCVDIFGIDNLTPNIKYINDIYGGWDIVSSNTVFTNGDVDPWHALGVDMNQNFSAGSNSASILIHGTAHCADLYSPQPTDLPTLTAARAQQDALLAQWLGVTDEEEKTQTQVQAPVETHAPSPAAPKAPKQKKHKRTKVILTEQ